MEEYYKFANVVLKIEHEDDEVFGQIGNEIKNYRTEKSDHHCLAKIRKSAGISIPNKAVRTNALDGQAIYSHKQQIFIVGKDNSYVISVSTGLKEITADYAEDDPILRKMLRVLLKWSIIVSAQENGLSYIHAAGAHYKGKNIIFCGDSHCGKSSALLRLIQNGAKAISDDSVLFDGRNLIPFTMNTTIDEDLQKRFCISPQSFEIEKYVDHGSEYGKPDMVVFLKIWNNETSEIRGVDYNMALLSLIKIYKKEINLLWGILNRDVKEGSGDIFRKYAALLEGTKCFEFCAGYNEEEVRKSLIDFLESH